MCRCIAGSAWWRWQLAQKAITLGAVGFYHLPHHFKMCLNNLAYFVKRLCRQQNAVAFNAISIFILNWQISKIKNEWQWLWTWKCVKFSWFLCILWVSYAGYHSQTMLFSAQYWFLSCFFLLRSFWLMVFHFTKMLLFVHRLCGFQSISCSYSS